MLSREENEVFTRAGPARRWVKKTPNGAAILAAHRAEAARLKQMK